MKHSMPLQPSRLGLLALPGDNYTYYEGFLGDYITPPSPAEKAEGEAALLAFARG